jgi:hypothetical protein
LVYSRRYPKYSRLTLPWILSGYKPFLRFSPVGGRIGSEGRLAFGLAAEYLLSPTISGEGAAIVPFARLKKAIKNVPLARLMVLAYYFFFYNRNSTKMRHFNNLPWDDGSRWSPRCPPSHPLMALPSHPAQASVRMAQPSGPSMHAALMGRVSPLLHQLESTTYSPPTSATMGGGILSNGSSSDAVGTSNIIVSLDGSIF